MWVMKVFGMAVAVNLFGPQTWLWLKKGRCSLVLPCFASALWPEWTTSRLQVMDDLNEWVWCIVRDLGAETVLARTVRLFQNRRIRSYGSFVRCLVIESIRL